MQNVFHAPGPAAVRCWNWTLLRPLPPASVGAVGSVMVTAVPVRTATLVRLRALGAVESNATVLASAVPTLPAWSVGVTVQFFVPLKPPPVPAVWTALYQL